VIPWLRLTGIRQIDEQKDAAGVQVCCYILSIDAQLETAQGVDLKRHGCLVTNLD
jgi:hypothetical protein